MREEKGKSTTVREQQTYLSHGVYGGSSQFMRQIVSLDQANTMLALTQPIGQYTMAGHVPRRMIVATDRDSPLHFNRSLHHPVDNCFCPCALRLAVGKDSYEPKDSAYLPKWPRFNIVKYTFRQKHTVKVAVTHVSDD